MKNTASIWYLLKPQFKRLWSGQLIYIGLNGWGIQIDIRGINSIDDLVDSMRYPKTWHILRRFRK